MRFNAGVLLLSILVVAVGFAAPVASNAAGAPDSAFDGGCGCHGGTSSAVTVTLSGPPEYAAGGTYDMTLRIAGGPMPLPVAAQNQGGLAVRVNIGSFKAGPGTQVRNEGLGITHTAQGNDQRTWSFQWVAPAAALGNATFTGHGNAVDGNTQTAGDQWNTGTLVVPPAKPIATANPTNASSPKADDTPNVAPWAAIAVLVVAASVWRRRRA